MVVAKAIDMIGVVLDSDVRAKYPYRIPTVPRTSARLPGCICWPRTGLYFWPPRLQLTWSRKVLSTKVLGISAGVE